MLAILLQPLAIASTAQANAAQGIMSGTAGLGSTTADLVEPVLMVVFAFAVLGIMIKTKGIPEGMMYRPKWTGIERTSRHEHFH